MHPPRENIAATDVAGVDTALDVDSVGDGDCPKSGGSNSICHRVRGSLPWCGCGACFHTGGDVQWVGDKLSGATLGIGAARGEGCGINDGCEGGVGQVGG